MRFSRAIFHPYKTLVQDQLLSYFVPCYQILTWAQSGVIGSCSPFHASELIGTAILH